MSLDNLTASLTSIEARDLSVVLGGREIIDIPTLNIYKNEVLAIIGPNGSGKTTLLLALSLLVRPETESSILYLGEQVKYGSNVLKLRRRSAVLFQEPLLLAGNVWDNVTLGLRLRGVQKGEINVRAEKWMERFGITGFAKRQVKTLSGGEAKRVSLARAFVLQPEILFLDEPFTALDSPTRQSLMEDFESVLRETKVTTVMVTHDRNEAILLASRIAVLLKGRIWQIGTPEEVFSHPVDEDVAGFVEAGTIIHGIVNSHSGGLSIISAGGKEITLASDLAPGKEVTLFLRHEDITLCLPNAQSGPTSARNNMMGKVTRLFPIGSQMRVTLDCGFPLVALITKQSAEDLQLAQGSDIIATFKATAVHVIKSQ